MVFTFNKKCRSNVIIKLINYSHKIILKYDKIPVYETKYQFENITIELMRIKLFQHWISFVFLLLLKSNFSKPIHFLLKHIVYSVGSWQMFRCEKSEDFKYLEARF